jgi:hypothetical protein
MTNTRSHVDVPAHGSAGDAKRPAAAMSVQAGSAGTTRRSPFRIPVWLGFCAFLAIAVFFLWQEHRAHLLGALPWVLLLLCPVLHLFMHHGEGHEGGNHTEQGAQTSSRHGAGDES